MVRAGRRDPSIPPGLSPWLAPGEGGVTLEIVARPGASRRGIVRVDSRGLIIALNSAPEKGNANDELIAYLARELGIARSSIAIVRGATSRRKTVRIERCDAASIAVRLDALLRAAS
jgi:uncharacterized protein (TIGR00251 family)